MLQAHHSDRRAGQRDRQVEKRRSPPTRMAKAKTPAASQGLVPLESSAGHARPGADNRSGLITSGSSLALPWSSRMSPGSHRRDGASGRETSLPWRETPNKWTPKRYLEPHGSWWSGRRSARTWRHHDLRQRPHLRCATKIATELPVDDRVLQFRWLVDQAFPGPRVRLRPPAGRRLADLRRGAPCRASRLCRCGSGRRRCTSHSSASRVQFTQLLDR